MFSKVFFYVQMLVGCGGKGRNSSFQEFHTHTHLDLVRVEILSCIKKKKCFLQKDTCFSKQNVFKNTFTMLISPKKVFFLSLKRIKIYLLKKFFYHVKKMFVCFQNLFNIVIFLCTLISSLFLE